MTDKNQGIDRLRAVLAASGDVVYEWDLTSGMILWHGSLTGLFGPDAMADIGTGEGFNRWINPQDLPGRLKALSDHFAGTAAFDCEYRVSAGPGRFLWVHDRGSVDFDETGRPILMVGTLRAVDDRKEIEARLERSANYDELTGLFNSMRLRDTLDHALAFATRYDSPGAYIVAGIDKLSLINDTFGYQTADAVIIEIGRRLERSLRASDLVGRVGGARFGIVLSHCSEAVAMATADKILCAVRMTPVETPGGPLHMSISVGIVNFPGLPDSVYDIMTKAETALHEAKKQGRNCFVSYYKSEVQRDLRRNSVRIAERVRFALEQDRIVFAYQPIVAADTGEVAYYECLLRMVAEDGEIVAAGEFIPVVEQLGLIRPIDRYVLEMALDEMSCHPEVRLAINVSGLTVTDPSWLRACAAILRRKPEVATRLTVEITETAVMQDIGETARFVGAMRDLGCRVALDDFGSGYTSFRHLKALTVDVVKIDGSFVQNVSNSVDNQLFIRTLVGLAEGFDLETVAEFVETRDDADFLMRSGVGYLQGYLFGRPTLERSWLSGADTTAPTSRSGKTRAAGA